MLSRGNGLGVALLLLPRSTSFHSLRCSTHSFSKTPSWTWYYPEHFAPFASDFVGVAETVLEFHPGKPFAPYEQLMAVFPAARY